MPKHNEEEIRADMAMISQTPEDKGVVLKGFDRMIDMVEYAVEEGWKKALQQGEVEEEEDDVDGEEGGTEETKGQG